MATEPIRVRKLEKTCEGCPAQWEGETIDGKIVYVRVRWGYLAMSIGDTIEQAAGENYGNLMNTKIADWIRGEMELEEMLRITGIVIEERKGE